MAATWDNHVAGNNQVGQGVEATATFSSTNKLPPNNADYGRKTITLLLNSDIVGTTDIEVFYLKLGVNHPGPNLVPPTAQNPGQSKNWFYYWRQEFNLPNNVYYHTNTIDQTGEVPAMARWRYNRTWDKSMVWIDDKATASYTRRDGSGAQVSGIDMFANCLAHEMVHVDQIQRADALLDFVGVQQWIWFHGWSWNVALNNHFTPGADGKPGRANIDDNGNGTIDEGFQYSQFRTGFHEFGALNSDDVNLDADNNGVPDSWVTNGFPNPIEAEAWAAETIVNNTHWLKDWAQPGKQHMTNQQYDN